MLEDANTPKWFLLIVAFKSEQKVAYALQSKGYEVLLPMHTVQRKWSDRVKTYSTPLFPSRLFCRFPPQREHEVMVCRTPGVFSVYEREGKPFPIPDSEVATLRLLAASSYPMESSDLPVVGDVVLVGNDTAVRGVLVERNTVCRVGIGFASTGHTVVLRVPLDALRRVDGPLTHHWSLTSL